MVKRLQVRTKAEQREINKKKGDGRVLKELAQKLILFRIDFVLGDERERILNPKKNVAKYNLLCSTWLDCIELAEQFEGKLEGCDPDFPKDCHIINLSFPTEDREIIMREVKTRLASAINNADEVNIDTDLKGNLRICFGFEDIYTPREV